jgi:hypothetical protein
MAASTMAVVGVFAYALTDQPVKTRAIEERIEEEEKREVTHKQHTHTHTHSLTMHSSALIHARHLPTPHLACHLLCVLCGGCGCGCDDDVDDDDDGRALIRSELLELTKSSG